MTTEPIRTAVAIVGGGPCGLVLAIELGQHGVPCVLLNDRPGTTTLPQANATQSRTMEHYRRLGLADEVRAQGLPADYPTDIAYFTRFARDELARFSLPSAKMAGILSRGSSGSWSTAELPHRCSQLYIEQVLHRHAGRVPGIDLRYGCRVLAVAQDDDGVWLEAEPIGTGAPLRIRADYAVGCDGPRSLVRKSLAISYGGEGGAARDFLGGRMHAVFVRAPGLYDVIPHPPAWMYWAVNPERRGFMAAIDGRELFAFHTQLRLNVDPTEPTEAEARAMVEAALGAECGFEIISRASWTAGFTLVAEAFGTGRIFLAGDAAHLFTPTGGLGYNTAVEDAVNLGWKLAAMVRGWGGPRLLESYEAERRPAALRNTAYARSFANSIGNFRPDPDIESDAPSGRQARAAAGDYLNSHARAEFNIPGITLGARYDGSPVIVPDGTLPPPDTASVYVPSACPGGRAPHVWLPGGRSLFDAFGRGFTLLKLGSCGEEPTRSTDCAELAGLQMTVLDLTKNDLRDVYSANLALVRPDQVVAWRGDTMEAARAALTVASGHSS